MIPLGTVNGRLAEESPSIVNFTLDYNATGKGITHFPMDFARLGPIVGVNILDAFVICRLVGAFM